MAAASPLPFKSRRSAVLGTHGMVACSQPLASEIGLRILKAGGNAADAAVAIAAALQVTEPCSTGLGGDCFALFYDAATGSVSAVNGSGRAPAALTRERAMADAGLDEDATALPATHIHTVTVPGAAAGWADVIDRWGTMSLAEVVEPAAVLADEGFPVSRITARSWAKQVDKLLSGPHCEELLIDGQAPEHAQLFRNPTLAATLRLLGEGGAEAFYSGAPGEAIVELVQQLGGVMTADDLAAHRSTFPEAISARYGDTDVYEVPPNGQGITALLALNILAGMDIASCEHGSAEYTHRLIEALRLAFADARKYVADMDACEEGVPVAELLSAEYAKERRACIDVERASVDVKAGSPFASCDTVSFQVVDGDGNAVSFVNSNYMGFGTGLVPRGCGFTLQNRGANFSLVAGHRNVLAGGKRPYHTIIPALALREGRLFSTFTVMGGFMQPQGHVQVLLNMIEAGMDAQEALDAARFCIGDVDRMGDVFVEDGMDDDVVDKLRAMGHSIVVRSGYERMLFGRGQIIVRREDGVLIAGSDGRADGCAMGW
eukprot:PLAT12502.23.p1 GENE.PLAT12502.23~~PLAT12502.23.p1  ORF type:complete len:547 (+),score=202.28 PLAT12502.23:155-1795(+)